MNLAVASWSLCYFFWQISSNKYWALFWTRALTFGSTLIPILHLHWILTLLGIRRNKVVIFGYLITIFFILANFTPLLVKEVAPIPPFPYWPKPGPLYIFYIVLSYFGLMVGYATFQLLKSLKTATGHKKAQIKYLIAGTLVGTLAGASNFPLWFDIYILPYGNILVSLYTLIFTYAMVKHRLMDIRIVVRQVTVYGVSLIVSLGFSVLLMLLAFNYLSFYISSIWIGIFILAFGIIIFQLTKDRFSKFANRHLFYTLYSYEKTISDLIEKLSKTIDLNRLVFLSTETIKDVMKLDKIALILRKLEPPKGQLKLLQNHHKYNDLKDILRDTEGEEKFYLARNISFEEESISSLIKNKFLIHYLERGKSLIVKDELKRLAEDSNDEHFKNKFLTLVDFMTKTEANIYLPLIIEDRLIGLFILGKKVSGDAYTAQDISLLETVASQVSIAVNNAQLYEQSQYFNQILRMRVIEATKELAGAYRELKKLDDSKTEFLSLASHQLRTPLSAIKGYLSMVLEGNFGKLQKETEEALKNVYQSNEHLIALVNDLLNITRIEAGRLEYHPQETDLGKLIEEVIKESELAAKNKGLDLKYKASKLPLVKIDPDKIRQVLINLIDNALKYTRKGSVTVWAKRMDSKILVEVKDTGIGISPDKMDSLFEWFSRGKGAYRLASGGFGLGLYIAKKIIEKANGKIWAESPGENKGSTFSFTLPIE